MVFCLCYRCTGNVNYHHHHHHHKYHHHHQHLLCGVDEKGFSLIFWVGRIFLWFAGCGVPELATMPLTNVVLECRFNTLISESILTRSEQPCDEGARDELQIGLRNKIFLCDQFMLGDMKEVVLLPLSNPLRPLLTTLDTSPSPPPPPNPLT